MLHKANTTYFKGVDTRNGGGGYRSFIFVPFISLFPFTSSLCYIVLHCLPCSPSFSYPPAKPYFLYLLWFCYNGGCNFFLLFFVGVVLGSDVSRGDAGNSVATLSNISFNRSDAGSSTTTLSSVQFNRSDEWLIRNWGVLSAEELAAQTGQPAEVVYRRAKEILGSVDVLSAAELRAKLMVQLQSVANTLEERIGGADAKEAAALASSLGGLLKTVLSELRAVERDASAGVELAVERYGELWAKLTGELAVVVAKRLVELFNVPVEVDVVADVVLDALVAGVDS